MIKISMITNVFLGCVASMTASTSMACSQVSKCMAQNNTETFALTQAIKQEFKKTHDAIVLNSLTTDELDDVFDVVFYDLNDDYLNDALIRQKPTDTKDNTVYPLYIYEHVGTDDQPVFKKAFKINNAMLPVVVLEKQTKGWRDIVINTNQYTATFASALFHYNGKQYVRSPNAFLGAVLTKQSDNQRIAEYSECIEKNTLLRH